MSKKMCLVAALVVVALTAVPGFAAAITVNNSSFEQFPAGGLPYINCGVGCSYSIDQIPDWTSSGAGASGQFKPGTLSGNFAYFHSLSDGPSSAYSEGGTISQMVGSTVVVGEVYTLLVDIGYRLDSAFAGTADLLINGNRYAAAAGVTPTRGTFGTFSVAYTGQLADLGSAITVELNSIGSQGNFDNVILDGTLPTQEAPEPASFLLIGPALLALKAIQRRRQAA